MDELKPCPFCGATAQVIEEVTGFPDELEYFVLCDDLECENRTGPHSTKSAAISVWNRRAAPENKRTIDANALSDEIKHLRIFLSGESIFTPAIKETILRTIDEQPTVGSAPENKPLTNGDHIRKMSNEELSELLNEAEGAGYNDTSLIVGEDHYPADKLDWLNQPYAHKPEQEELKCTKI